VRSLKNITFRVTAVGKRAQDVTSSHGDMKKKEQALFRTQAGDKWKMRREKSCL
jgi:hypothetical protein